MRSLKEGGERAFRQLRSKLAHKIPKCPTLLTTRCVLSCRLGDFLHHGSPTHVQTGESTWWGLSRPRALPDGWGKGQRVLKCWQKRCPVFRPWELGWAGWEVKTDGVHFQGESGSLHGLGSHKVSNQEPELRVGNSN